MTIATGGVWEVRPTNGSDTNGGAYVWGAGVSLATPTDLAIDATNANQVSSSSYGFSSADVNRFIKITAGTGFLAGFFQILSVTSGKATLNNNAGTAGSTSGSATVYSGVDYSQKNAKNTTGSNISTTDAVAIGTTTLTSATAAFTADITGNVIYLAGGSGSLAAGWYQVVTYTNATTVVLDRTVAAGTGITLNIGGALQTMAVAAAQYKSGHRIYVKAESTITTATNIIFATASSPAAQLIGYTTARGDNGQVHVQATAGMGASGILNITSTGFEIYNFFADINAQTGTSVRLDGIYNTINNSKIIGPGSAANYGINLASNGGGVYNCEVTGGAGGTTGYGIYLNGESGNVINCYVHDNANPGIVSTSYGGTVDYNICYNNSGASSDGISLLIGSCGAKNNTVDSNGRHGINCGPNAHVYCFGNMLTNSGRSTGTNATTAYGISSTAGTLSASSNWDGNCFWNNLTGDVSVNVADLGAGSSAQANNGCAPYTYSKNVFLTSTPYVSAPTNWGLNGTTGGGGSARFTSSNFTTWPALGSTVSAPSFGAVQPSRASLLPTVGYGSA